MKKQTNTNKLHKLVGIGQAFVLVSIAHTSYTVIMGTTELIPTIMTIPAITYAVVLLISKFTK